MEEWSTDGFVAQESGAGEGTSTADAEDEDSARLNEIYERLQVSLAC